MSLRKASYPETAELSRPLVAYDNAYQVIRYRNFTNAKNG